MTTPRVFSRLPHIGLILAATACGQLDGEVDTTRWLPDAGSNSNDTHASTTAATTVGNKSSDETTTSSSDATTTITPTTSSSGTAVNPATTTSSSSASTNTTSDATASNSSTSTATETSNSQASEESGSEATSSDDITSDTPPSEEVPMTDHCQAVAVWDEEWSQWEDEVLLLVNEYRAEGADCGEEGVFGPAEPLAMDPVLRCSSRLHSLDMFDRMYFDHTNPDDLDPFDRMALAGFEGSYMGENIAQGQTDPEEVMRAWIDSDGHCSNVLNPNFTLIGVGYYPGSPDDFRSRHYWTQNFGTPRQQSGGGMGGFGN